LTCQIPRAQELIGRDKELDAIAAFCRGGQQGSTLAMVGPPGVGKARLIGEASRRLNGQVTTFVASGDPSGARLPWYPVLTMLEAVLGLEGSIEYDDLGRAAARSGLPDRDVPGLAEIFAVEGPAHSLELAVRRREAQAAALRALLAVHRRFPR